MVQSGTTLALVVGLLIVIVIGVVSVSLGQDVVDAPRITLDLPVFDEAFTGLNESNVSLANTDIDANSTLIQNLTDNLTEGTDYNMSNELGTILMINDTYNGVALNATYEYTSTVDRFTGTNKILFGLVILMLVLIIVVAIAVIVINTIKKG